MQKVLEYIDSRLGERLDADELAAVAGFSPWHFAHVFRYGVGYPVMEYVRRRRLVCAAAELASDRRIIDIAVDYGFETHSGFSKAFRRQFGCPPEVYRIHAQSKRPELPSLAHMRTYMTGGIVMEPKFVSRPAIRLAGYVMTTKNTEGENSTDIPAFWLAYLTNGRAHRLHSESFVQSHAEYGACFPEDAQTGEFEYLIGLEIGAGTVVPPEYKVRELPAATYVVFSPPPSDRSGFTAAIQGTWQYIFNEWFPTSGYEYAQGCVDFEYYDAQSMGENNNVCDIYIPVSRKG